MKRRYSSSDSEDDEPLVSHKYNVITKKDLLQTSLERCEFCDAVFYDKYNMLIHSASHIIIPLLHQGIHQCAKCSAYFNSIESLEKHNLSDHINIVNQEDYPEIITSILKKEPYAVLTKEEFEVHDEKFDTDILESFVLKQPVTLIRKEEFTVKDENVVNETQLLESFVVKSPITLIKPLVISNEIIDISDESSSSDLDIDQKPYFIQNCLEQQENRIKDRIIFEDEFIGDDIFDLLETGLNDITASKGNLVNSDKRGNLKMNTIILGKHPKNEEYKSIHYDELVKPGFFKCKNCRLTFSNRYKLLIHETEHLKYKRRVPFHCKLCDWYVSDNPWGYKKHLEFCHPGQPAPHRKVTRCTQCNLNYVKYHRHMRNYHHIYMCKISECNQRYDNYLEFKDHIKVVHKKDKKSVYGKMAIDNEGDLNWYTKRVKVCDVCLLFFKNKSNIHYEHLEDVFELGVRQQCERCGAQLFELNLVQFKAKKRANYGTVTQKKKTPSTNEDRLNNVRRRLKKLKLMNKY